MPTSPTTPQVSHTDAPILHLQGVQASFGQNTELCKIKNLLEHPVARFLLSSWWTPFGFPNLRGFIWREKMAFFEGPKGWILFCFRNRKEKKLPFFDFHSHANVYHSSSQDRRVIDDCEFASWLLSKKKLASLASFHSCRLHFFCYITKLAWSS